MIPPEIEAVCLLGWRVYPCSRKSKAACFKGASAAASYDLNVVAQWCREFPAANWRVVMAGSGIWGLDIDAPTTHGADGIQAMKDLVAAHGPLPERPTTRSGGGGYAMFFKHTREKIAGKTGTPLPGIDPRRGNLSVTIPPSIHIDTRRPYRWLMPPWKLTPPEAPAWLLRLVAPPPEPVWKDTPIVTSDAALNQLYRAVSSVADAREGGRNHTLNTRSFQVGRILAGGMIGEQQAIEALYSAARRCGLDHHETKATIMSGVKSGLRRGPYG